MSKYFLIKTPDDFTISGNYLPTIELTEEQINSIQLFYPSELARQIKEKF